MNSFPSRFGRNPDFIFRRIADELILVPIRQQVGDLQSIYTLTPVAAAIWEWLDGATTVGAIVRRLVEDYDVTVGQAEVDVQEFLHALHQLGAVRPVAEEAG
jgi:hypothetical protein